MSLSRLLLGLTPILGLTLSAATAVAQDERPVAITNARILTMSGKPIDNGTVLMQEGVIKQVGKKVKVPAGAKVIDAEGGTVMPGLVHAWSKAGLRGRRQTTTTRMPGMPRRFRGGRRFGSSASAVNKAGKKVSDSLYARQDIFHDLLECGVTTLVLAPDGVGFPGLSAQIEPTAKHEEGFILDDDAYVVVECIAKSQAKNTVKSALDAGKKALEERKKPKEEPKKDDKAAAKKPTGKPEKKTDPKPADKKDKPKEEPKPTPKPKDDPKPKPKDDPKPKEDPKKDPKKDEAKKADDKSKKPAPKKREKKKDPNAEVVADLLDKKRRAFVVMGSANQLAHYMDAVGDHRFPMTIVAQRDNTREGSLHMVAKKLEELEAGVLMAPELSTQTHSNRVSSPSEELRKAGLEVGFLIGDSKSAVRGLFFKLIDLVRHGAKPQDVLRGVTAVPAKMLGMDKQVGTIGKGKQANLLLFTGDPLDPTSSLRSVFYRGAEVRKDANQ